jgi:riboflavin biosynthesis pyrimidine reductase
LREEIPSNLSVIQLFPLPGGEIPLKGLYLSQALRELVQVKGDGHPFVYSNFITSLDGRIAIPHPDQPGMVIPPATANPRDWRLFQELAIQADLILTTGRYLRDYADGRAQEILRVYDDPAFSDLKDWRLDNGLHPQPDLAVVSSSLEFPIPQALIDEGRSVLIITDERANPERIRMLENRTGRVLIAGEKRVEGRQLVDLLSGIGYSLIYSSAGPKVHHMLLAAGVLDRLYLTFAGRILGGKPFSSIVDGSLLDPAADFHLTAAYLDPHAFGGTGQLFTIYDR